jgi:hypothetical protein
VNVKIEELPVATDLANDDVFVLNKHDSYTAKINAAVVKQAIVSEINSTTYQADNTTIGLSSNNTFYVKPGGIDFTQLSPGVLLQIQQANSGVGQTITGSLSTFTTPLTASGEFLVLLVDNKAVALRVWNYA